MQVLLPVMPGCLLYSGAGGAQSASAKQEAQELLGKPQRTALKALSHESTPERWQSTSWDWTGY